jgi:RNA polymerase sigma factor (sigma-70 family)
MAVAAAVAVMAAAVTTEVIRFRPSVDRDAVSPLLLRRLSDESLGRRLAQGEAAAFDELYRRYVHRLAGYGAQLLGDAADGDDVAQSSLLKAYGALRDGRVPDRVKPWLFRIAHNTAIDLVVRRREIPAESLPDRPAPERGAEVGALVAALASLPDRQRHVYLLREVHGLRIDETAAELGLTATQVEQALFAARNRLAEHLVFGDRLSCVAVRRLAAGPLDGDERRALKTHLRSCAECRRAVPAAGRVLGLLPAGAADWLRALPGLLVGGGAPAAVKVGAVVATATLATGAPIAYDITRDQNPRHASAAPATPQHAAVRKPTMHLRLAIPRAPLVSASELVSETHRVTEHASARKHRQARRADEQHGGRSASGSDDRQSGQTPQATAPSVTTESGGEHHDGGSSSGSDTGSSSSSGPGGGGDTPTVTIVSPTTGGSSPATAPATTTDGHHDDGSSSSSGTDGGGSSSGSDDGSGSGSGDGGGGGD